MKSVTRNQRIGYRNDLSNWLFLLTIWIIARINSNSKYEEKVKRKKSDGFDAWSSKLKSDLETKRKKQSEIFSLYYFD